MLCVQIVVNEDGIHSLLIMSATRHDTGIYTCIARNKAGEDTFSVTLTILGGSWSAVSLASLPMIYTMYCNVGDCG